MSVETEKLSHIDYDSNQPVMVDVGEKQITHRRAIAQSILWVGKDIMPLLEQKDIQTKKGPVFSTAIIAGTMAVKQTSQLIPLCHPLPVDHVIIDIIPGEEEISIKCTVAVNAKTGVEMEALTGASIAALTVYDMLKALSHGIIIRETKLLEKTGGKSDYRNK